MLKWKGYSSRYNTWEPANSVNCNDLIAQFESSRMESILGADVDAATGGITYFLKLKKQESFEMKTSQQVKEFWPHLLVDFLQSRISYGSIAHAFPGGNPIVETENPSGIPLRIICKYC